MIDSSSFHSLFLYPTSFLFSLRNQILIIVTVILLLFYESLFHGVLFVISTFKCKTYSIWVHVYGLGPISPSGVIYRLFEIFITARKCFFPLIFCWLISSYINKFTHFIISAWTSLSAFYPKAYSCWAYTKTYKSTIMSSTSCNNNNPNWTRLCCSTK